MHALPNLLSVARGDSPADLVLRGGRVVNVFNGQVEEVDVAIAGGQIAGLGQGYEGRQTLDLHGVFVAPGLIDAHVHIESSLCVPTQFAAAVLPWGVTAVVTDPHEIANVAGVEGVRFMAEASRGLPLDVTIMAPSCVPATHMATSGGAVTSGDIRALRESGVAHGLAEAMNFPGVIAGDAEMLAKIAAMRGRSIDGHAPGVSGRQLNAYAAAGVGSDHECVTADEARERLARGMYLLIREATGARNFDALLAAVTPANARRVCFCTDDRTPVHLLADGSVDELVRRAIAAGIEPIEAIRMATLNPAEWFGLRHLGAIAPGRAANLIVYDDLRNPVARIVIVGGTVVAEDGKLTDESWLRGGHRIPGAVSGACRVDVSVVRWEIVAKSSRVRVIGALPQQLVTEHRVLPATVIEGNAVADVSRDLLKMAVLERHRGTGNVGLGFIQGIGLKSGALAGTVAHDHHNLVCIGADDVSIRTACGAVAGMGGGLAVAAGERILATLPLPVAGLMSDRPVAEVAAGYARVVAAAKDLGSPLPEPFMAMSFMALEVIPSLKLTDQGLVDVEAFKIVDLFA